MPVPDLFADLEPEVAASADSVDLILRNYPSSQAGKSQIADLSGAYYRFFGDLWEGIGQTRESDAELLKEHLSSRLSLDLNILSVVIYRSFRRALYCRLLNGIDLAQMKQAGLYAHWIAKLRPIVIGKAPESIAPLRNDLEQGVQEINARFAFHIVHAFYKEEFGMGLMDCPEYQKHFVHAATYRSFTEDSMMLATESLGVVGSTVGTTF